MRLPTSLCFFFFLVIMFQIPCDAQYSRHESIGLSPTAFNLQKGEKRITNTMLLYNSYTQGISNNLSISLGVSPLIPYWQGTVRMKYSQPISKNIRVGISPIFSYANWQNNKFNPQLAGSITIGSPNSFVNLSYSKVIDIGRTATPQETATIELTGIYNYFSVGGSLRITDTFSVLSENNFVVDSDVFSSIVSYHSMMVRWRIKPNQTLQFGAYQILELGSIILPAIPVPAISYSLYWGLKK